MNLKTAFQRMNECEELAGFYRQWAAAASAGLPMSGTLSMLSKGAPMAVAHRLEVLQSALELGDHEVLQNSSAFSDLERAFLRVGVMTGTQERALMGLSSVFAADLQIVRLAKRRVAYPLIVAFCACWIPTAPIAFYSTPASWMVVSTLLSAVVLLFGGIYVTGAFTKLRGGPKWSQIRFFTALGTALDAGIGVDEALGLAAQCSAPSQLSSSLRYAVPNGRAISEVLRSSGCFDEAALSMVQSGEVSGRLPQALFQAASYLEGGIL